jgi:FMN reductase (NADPH)
VEKNQTITTLMNHVSVRFFTDTHLSDEQVKVLLTSAQAAASSNFLQAYSIIGIDDSELLKKLAHLAGEQPFVATASNFFIFCADLRRNEEFMAHLGGNITQEIEGADAFLVAAVDASLAAQNMVIAAESMGLGTCYIGGVRERIEEISDLLELPDHVFPVFGVVVGYPAEENTPKPRLPLSAIYSTNKYNSGTLEVMKKYNSDMQAYYARRTADGVTPHRTWAQGIARTFSVHPRKFMLEFLQRRGWVKH